jgi:hypothetical protein
MVKIRVKKNIDNFVKNRKDYFILKSYGEGDYA